MENGKLLEKQSVNSDEIQKSIPFLGGRPDRDTVISEEDITDLKINLNVTHSVEEFLQLI